MLASMNRSQSRPNNQSNPNQKQAETQNGPGYADCADYADYADYAGDLDYPVNGTYAQAYNAGVPLSGGAVSVAWKNAKSMVTQGYGFVPDGVFHWHGGCVTNPLGRCYDVYLPGAYPEHPEGKCNCAFFGRHAICKHIYFAIEQTRIIQAVTAQTNTTNPAPARPASPRRKAASAPGF